MKRGTLIMTMALAALLTGSAQAASVTTLIYQVNGDTGLSDLSGISVAIDVSDTGSGYKFAFSNTSTVESSIRTIYFDNSLTGALASDTALIETVGDVDYSKGNLARQPWGVDLIPWTTTLVAYNSNNFPDKTDEDYIRNGINNGGLEQLMLTFPKVAGTNLDTLLNLLATGGGLSLHLIDVNGKGVDVYVDLHTPEPIHDDIITTPTPSSAVAGIALLTLAATRRRRTA